MNPIWILWWWLFIIILSELLGLQLCLLGSSFGRTVHHSSFSRLLSFCLSIVRHPCIDSTDLYQHLSIVCLNTTSKVSEECLPPHQCILVSRNFQSFILVKHFSEGDSWMCRAFFASSFLFLTIVQHRWCLLPVTNGSSGNSPMDVALQPTRRMIKVALTS